MKEAYPLLFAIGFVFLACGRAEWCYQDPDIEGCSSYSEDSLMLNRCATDMVPGCHVEERCTDEPVGDTNSDSDSAPGDTETPVSYPLCRQYCVGEIESCDEKSESQCNAAEHCAWFGEDDQSAL